MSDQPLILIVEDEEHIAQALIFNLQAEGFRTHHESDGEEALQWLLNAAELPSAVLLDVMLPGRDGFSIVRALRDAEIFTPVIMLTARGRTEDVVEGFAAGADDYVSKPFDLDVLLARLTGLLRRMHWNGPATIESPANQQAPDPRDSYELGDRTINFDALEVRTPEKTIHLTLMEAELLRYLIDRPGKIIPRKEILEKVWRVHEDTDTRAVDNFIVRLRRYIEVDPSKPEHLKTIRGVGYRFVEDQDRPRDTLA
jgi:DNA-binding response OmpR family regulator